MDLDLTENTRKLIEENQILRRMLAFSVVGSNLYHDDGELQDNSEFPWIDWKRDEIGVIRQKLAERNLNALKRDGFVTEDGHIDIEKIMNSGK